jgi:histidinol-phosphate aminotransferase
MQRPDRSRHPERRHESSFREAVRSLEDYEPGRSVQQVSQEFGIPIDEIVKLASNENPYGPSPAAIAAIPTEFGNLHMYPWQEFADLRRCVAETNGVEPDNVVLGSGSESIVQMIPRLYVEPGDEVIVSPQSYSRYAAGSALMNAVVRLVSLRDYHFDLDAVAGAANERTRIVWLCNPNNPTGTIIRRDEMLRFLDTMPETVAVVLDQAYGEFADDPQYAEGVRLVRDGYPNVIVLKTFSKAYALAGVRLGYAIADGAICQMLDRIEEPFFLNRAATAAGPAALADTGWLERSVTAIREGRAYLSNGLSALGCTVVPSQANFVLADVGGDARALFERLLGRGLIVRPADAWGYPTHIRVTVGAPEQNETCLRLLAEELPSLRAREGRQAASSSDAG